MMLRRMIGFIVVGVAACGSPAREATEPVVEGTVADTATSAPHMPPAEGAYTCFAPGFPPFESRARVVDGVVHLAHGPEAPVFDLAISGTSAELTVTGTYEGDAVDGILYATEDSYEVELTSPAWRERFAATAIGLKFSPQPAP